MTDQQTQEQDNVESQATETAPADVETLRGELETAQRQADENYDKYLRARADMENFRKRMERTTADREKQVKKNLLAKILQVKDNLERALSYGEGSSGQTEGIMQGVRLTEYQLNQLLEQEGVSRIEADGKPFDPSDEEAVQTVQDPSRPDHVVVQVIRQGYRYGDEVLRPAQVIVNVHQEEE
jgi:molecular chaperone GrpE